MKKAAGLILRLLISFGMIALVLWSQRQHLNEAFQILRAQILWPFVCAAVVFYVLALIVISLRLKLIFQVQHIRLSFKETFYLSWVGLFFNLFLPSAVGGDIMKAYYAAKHSGKKIQATTSIFWDRLLGFSALIIMAMIGVLLLNHEINDLRLDYLVILFLVFFGFMTLFFMSKRTGRAFKFLKHLIPSEKIRGILSEVYHAMHSFRSHPWILLQTLTLSFFGQAFFITVHYWLTLGIGVNMNLGLFFILIPVLSIVTMLPSIGGLGVREAALVFLFKNYMPNERALALSLLLDMLLYTLSFGAGIVYAFRGGLKSKAIQEMEALG